MLRYRIDGADTITGEHRRLVVSADSEADAVGLAKEQGLSTYHASIIPEAGKASGQGGTGIDQQTDGCAGATLAGGTALLLFVALGGAFGLFGSGNGETDDAGRPSISPEYTPSPSQPTTPPQQQSSGRVHYDLVDTFKAVWRREGTRHKSREEQRVAFLAMITAVEIDIDDPADQEATLDYIQRTIDSW